MLKKILAITGKPGLYKIVNHSQKSLIVEDLGSKKRMPVSPRDRVVSLGDIAMYTTSEDKPLGEVLDLVFAYKKGEPIDIKKLSEEKKLKTVFGEILPDFDEDRVRDSDIKKLFSWYNILINDGMKEFASKEEENAEKDNNTDSDEIKSEEKTKETDSKSKK